MTNRKPDWSGWNKWCDARIEAKHSFDREVFIGVIAELTGMIAEQEKELNAQSEKVRGMEAKVAELLSVNDLRSSEMRRTSALLAEHQSAIAELRCMARAERAKLIDLPDLAQGRGLN